MKDRLELCGVHAGAAKPLPVVEGDAEDGDCCVLCPNPRPDIPLPATDESLSSSTVSFDVSLAVPSDRFCFFRVAANSHVRRSRRHRLHGG